MVVLQYSKYLDIFQNTFVIVDTFTIVDIVHNVEIIDMVSIVDGNVDIVGDVDKQCLTLSKCAWIFTLGAIHILRQPKSGVPGPPLPPPSAVVSTHSHFYKP